MSIGQGLISQQEFIDQYNRGQRDFSNKLLQFIDVSSITFDNLVIKDSKLMFCTFRNCKMKNIAFENCEIYFGSFYTDEISGAVFKKCRFELTLFDNTTFKDVKMLECDIRFSGIFNSNFASVDTSTSSGIFVTDISQIPQQNIATAITEVTEIIQRLDVGLRMKIKEMMRQDLERYSLAHPDEKKDKRYGNPGSNANFTYGEAKMLIESAFGAYSRKKPYESEPKYESKHPYKR